MTASATGTPLGLYEPKGLSQGILDLRIGTQEDPTSSTNFAAYCEKMFQEKACLREWLEGEIAKFGFTLGESLRHKVSPSLRVEKLIASWDDFSAKLRQIGEEPGGLSWPSSSRRPAAHTGPPRL